MVRILVTNDDGVLAPGILPLAQAMTEHGHVTVVAPDTEYSGAGAAIGAIWERVPHVTRHRLDGVPEAWAVNGPPALAVMYARLGAFGDDPFDLVVSGINPGANVGRSVYHSGTVGACLSGRNGGWSGIAVSQASAGWGVEGQAWDSSDQNWATAATVASEFVRGFLQHPPADVVIANINVPNLDMSEIDGWALTEVGQLPPRSMSQATLVPRADQPDEFDVNVSWGEPVDLPEHTDGGTIERNRVSVTYLTRLEAETRSDMASAERALHDLLG